MRHRTVQQRAAQRDPSDPDQDESDSDRPIVDSQEAPAALRKGACVGGKGARPGGERVFSSGQEFGRAFREPAQQRDQRGEKKSEDSAADPQRKNQRLIWIVARFCNIVLSASTVGGALTVV